MIGYCLTIESSPLASEEAFHLHIFMNASLFNCQMMVVFS